MRARNNQNLEQEKEKLKIKVQADLRKLKEGGVEGFEGMVMLGETVAEALKRRIDGNEKVLKMLGGL